MSSTVISVRDSSLVERTRTLVSNPWHSLKFDLRSTEKTYELKVFLFSPLKQLYRCRFLHKDHPIKTPRGEAIGKNSWPWFLTKGPGTLSIREEKTASTLRRHVVRPTFQLMWDQTSRHRSHWTPGVNVPTTTHLDRGNGRHTTAGRPVANGKTRPSPGKERGFRTPRGTEWLNAARSLTETKPARHTPTPVTVCDTMDYVSTTHTRGRRVSLTWAPEPQSTEVYRVFRSPNSC